MGSVLSQPTLVLNRFWTPIQVCSVKKAVSLLFKGNAKAIFPGTFECHDFQSWTDLSCALDEPHIRTISIRIKIPEIILLMACNHQLKKKVVFSRRNLYRRDRNTCQYCGKRHKTEKLSIDHIVPRVKGGKSTWTNCVVACLKCNSRKSSTSLRKSGLTLLKQPVEPEWKPYFTLPLFKRHESWNHFISEAYWNNELDE
jgi:5-methylcytosine-specific restriction endonuclease McrA